MSTKLLTHPHFIINVDDRSGNEEIVVEESLGLHVPLFFVNAPKGKPNVPVYYQDTNSLKNALGGHIFDESTEYFGVDSIFLETCFSKQGGFVVRLSPEDAKTANILLECHLTKDVDVIQYQRDEFGGIVRDVDGNPVPVIDSGTSAPVTNKGVKLKWVKRVLDATETHPKEIKPKTVQEDTKTTTIFPVAVSVATSVGKAGNDLGFRFFYDKAIQQSDRLESNKSIEMSFAPVEKDYKDNTPTSIHNRWNNVYTTFMLKPRMFDSKVKQNLSYEQVLEDNYVAGTRSELPMTVYFFEEYIKEIGLSIVDVETNDVNLLDPYMVNPFTCMNLDGYAYHNVVLSTAGNVFFNSSYTIYLEGGDDGSTTRVNHEELIRQFLKMKSYPRLKDKFKFPITHLYDTGYSMDTKEAMIEFMGIRDDVRIEICTQDLSNEINDESEDQSSGVYLRTRALLQVESTEKGTSTCRCGVYAHSGKLYDARYIGYAPAVLDILNKRCTYQSTGFIKGSPKERPNSEVTMFKSLNWTAFDEDNKALFWDSGINYIQHCTRTKLFWPGLRTVHPIESSVLTEWTFVDALVYHKHTLAEAWTMFSDSERTSEDLFPAIQKWINKKCVDKFGTRYPIRVQVYQTEIDAKRGFVLRTSTYMTGRNGKRVWENDIYTLKEDTAFSVEG